MEGWGIDDPEVAAALTSTAYGQAARASAMAQFIPQVITDPKEARQRLMQLLLDSEATFPSLILRGLASLQDRGDEKEIVQQALAMRENRFIRSEETFDSELISGFPTHPEIRDFGLRLLEGRNPPVNALANSYQHDPEIRQKLLDIVVSIPASLRSEVAGGFARLASDPQLALMNLGRYDAESNADMKVLGSSAFHSLLFRHQTDTTSAVLTLSKAIRAYGFDHEARRQAAFAGILALKRLDLMNQFETIGPSKPISVRLETHGQLNLSLLRLVAQHWQELRTSFGDNLQERLWDQYSVSRLPGALALVAAEFPELQDEVWKAADLTTDDSNNVLRLLATVNPRSELLKQRCLTEIRRDDGTWGGIQRANFAATILGDNFAGNEEVSAQILLGRSAHQLAEGEIIALCAGWPDNPAIEELHDLFRKGHHPGLSIFGALSLLYASVSPENIAKILFHDLDTPRICNSRTYEALKGPIERRLKRDQEVRRALHDALRKGATTSAKATLPRLLVRVEGLTLELHQWVEEELAQQLSKNSIREVGFDLVEGSARSLALSLLDTLES